MSRFLALLLLLPVSSCILLVSTPESGEHCQFAGAQTTCGACVKSECQAEVDHCCGDPKCDATLALLEKCTTARDPSCAALKQGTGELSVCVKEHCRGSCAPLEGASQTQCEEPYAGQGTLCSCKLGPPVNDQLCSAALYPGTLCCAPQGWPQPGLECACKPVGCNPTADGCICSLVDYSFPDLARTCGGQHCCAAADNCRCGSLPCESWQKVVPSCDLGVFSCADNLNQVPSCSIPPVP